MSKPKLNIKEETSAKKTRSPPKKAKVEQSVPRKKKLKTDADKAAEKAQHLRGSPPRVRGKGGRTGSSGRYTGITPAHAGKRIMEE